MMTTARIMQMAFRTFYMIACSTGSPHTLHLLTDGGKIKAVSLSDELKV